MDRRAWLRVATACAGVGLLPDLARAAAMLRPSPRMPVVFVGHGSPMNAITDNEFRRAWQALGAEFGRSLPRPQLVLCVSAHWLTTGWKLTGMANPRTIHDFGGFPQALYDQRYPAPGAPAAAREIAGLVRRPALGLDEREWGYDHGAWSVLKPIFPRADIPVLQLSLDYARPPAEHFALGEQLRGLRDKGVLVVGSGNIVHNLRASRREANAMQAYDWAYAFDRRAAELIARGALGELPAFQQWGPLAQLAHPTHDHYLPLLHAAGAAHPGEQHRFLTDRYQSASISMRSVVWGG